MDDEINLKKRDKRIIMIKISVEGGKVKAKQVGHTDKMREEDIKHSDKFRAAVKNANDGKKQRNLKEILDPGMRVHDDKYEVEPEHEHARIHLYADAKDEIVWYSEEGIPFEVDINRDPQLVFVGNKPLQPTTSLEVEKNYGIDNPFLVGFPLKSENGEAVSSGPISGVDAVMDQRYYKYTVRVKDNKDLDPHVEGHKGF